MKFIALLLAGAFLAIFCFEVGAIEIGEYTDPEKLIKSETGKIIIIMLRSNRTTGYEWQLANPLNTGVVDLIRSEYVAQPTAVVGSGGTEIWSFRAIGEGDTKIDFKYVRPWEKDNEPAQKISFNVKIITPAIIDTDETEY